MKRSVTRDALSFAVLLLCAGAAAAQEAPSVNCENAMTQFEMNFCADQDYKTADKALNATYKQVMAHMIKLDGEMNAINPSYVGAVDALKTAQRAWIGYRDGQCELSGFSARGGSMEPMLVSGCLAELTSKRTVELKELLDAY